MSKKEYAVETMLIEHLCTMGYGFIPLHTYDDVVRNFKLCLEKLNASALFEAKGESSLSTSEFDRVMIHLDGRTVYESAKILRDQWVLQLDNGSTVYLKFLDEDYNRNIWQVTHQVTMDPAHLNDVSYKNRFDVTLLINGLPLVQIELKRPGIELNEAINQINRYRRFSFKGIFRYIQLFVVSNSTITKYFANANENYPDGSRQDILKSLSFFWTDQENKRIPKLMDFADRFLDRFHLCSMLTKYFIVKESEPVLMVMRPYQIYAVNDAYRRVVDSNFNGFVFHTTGSGKTLTSFRLATLLRESNAVDLVFFLIDRSDLDDQTVDEYNNFELGCVDSTTNTANLVNTIKEGNKKLIITTIQKMATALRNDKYSEFMKSVGERRCVFIIDECHRSQFGKMNADIRRCFRKSNFIGFTGTPIFEENKAPGGRTTADVFASGSSILPACIHRYMIKEAIADGNVLRFSVEYMNSVGRLNGTALPEDPSELKAKGIDIDDLNHNRTRMEMVADDILKNLDRHIHPEGKDVYTAIFATDRIDTLMRYYRYMRENNKKNYKIAAIFSTTPNEEMDEGVDENTSMYLEECIEDYNKMFGTTFDPTSYDAYRKDISKRMKQKSLPQLDLLIVVDMFLTGFDSKATNTLILDKNLQWHSLVQAYSRTNRISKTTKQFGQIITYRNIKKAQDDALRLYSGDGDPNEYLIETYEFYLAQYREAVEKLREICPAADDAADIQSEDTKREYIKAFREVAKVLAVLKTFSKFQWSDLDVFLNEDEYLDYKSWYLTFYDESRHPKGDDDTVLVDIDFEIELVRTDKINVVYILNLLKDINRNDLFAREQGIDLVLREIERSDNEKLRKKSDIMKKFVTDRFFDLEPDTDIA
ncbi:MAG: type I restriction endonuclease subunit R, partial [Bullifex sp.]